MTSFAGTLESAHGGGAYVEIPAEAIETLGGGARFRVRGKVNGREFESSTMGMGGGRVCVGVHKATRQALGVEPGATLHFEIERDERRR